MKTRYPLAPLAEALHIELGHMGRVWPDNEEPAGLTKLAEAIGIRDIRYMRRLLDRGLTDRLADRFATRAGFHPSQLWPTWWADATGEGDAWYADDPPMSTPDLLAAS